MHLQYDEVTGSKCTCIKHRFGRVIEKQNYVEQSRGRMWTKIFFFNLDYSHVVCLLTR